MVVSAVWRLDSVQNQYSVSYQLSWSVEENQYCDHAVPGRQPQVVVNVIPKYCVENYTPATAAVLVQSRSGTQTGNLCRIASSRALTYYRVEMGNNRNTKNKKKGAWRKQNAKNMNEIRKNSKILLGNKENVPDTEPCPMQIPMEHTKPSSSRNAKETSFITLQPVEMTPLEHMDANTSINANNIDFTELQTEELFPETLPSDPDDDNTGFEISYCDDEAKRSFQFNELFASMDCPSFTQKYYDKVQNKIYDDWRSTAISVMEAAGKRERDAAIAEGRVNKNGIACIDVIADGAWSKRSYNTNFSALSGAAAIIGKRFGEVLFIGVKNKYCCICARASNKNIVVEDHVCYKNYSGSSTGMESDLLLEGFKQSISMHNEHISKDADFDSKVNLLFIDITNSYNHAFGNHEHCQPYYCTSQKNSEDLTLTLKTCAIWHRIKFIVNTVASKARSLMHNSDSNKVESFNSIIAKFVGGKRINFSLRRGYESRCDAAVVAFNTKRPLSTLHRSILGTSPRAAVKRLEEKRHKQRMRKSTMKGRTLFWNRPEKVTDKNYGENCQKPDMSAADYDRCKEEFLKSLQCSDDERRQIEKKTILQRDSSEWLELRRKLLTASNFGKWKLTIKKKLNI
ncbi:hypothetical protein HW555_010917 [Spodoptera exigua]|uniref:Mutator-like transposase domain-containing protein n=1 Tax=Spodoptera exigua TaxID=7107 RepID=A0A835G8V6_SPOEX|nr:hypothetical protein HW555_010917 [Spodoptera exigua]